MNTLLSIARLFPFCAICLSLAMGSCRKSPSASTSDPGAGDTSTITPPVEPPLANTVGFFLDDWTPATFSPPFFEDVQVSGTATNTVTVDPSAIITKIPQPVFGQNAVFWLGPADAEPLFMNPLKNLQPHILRFPGGSASDAYFWNAPQGINPPDAPALIMDKDGHQTAPGYNYGMTDLNWQCSLNNYYHILQQSNSEGLLTVNYGYARYGTGANPVAAAAHLAADWVRYDNGRTRYWEIGNENFGDWEWGYRIDLGANKDGQPEYITGALYATHFQVFADSMRQAASETGKKIYIGAVTSEAPATESWQTNTLKTWNSGMMSGINEKADFYVVHNYFTPFNTNSNAADVLASAAGVPAQMISYVTQTLQSNGATV
ncbi:MAG TPA: alpha-L-arabinofuranosidase, partial [Puia sp.]